MKNRGICAGRFSSVKKAHDLNGNQRSQSDQSNHTEGVSDNIEVQVEKTPEMVADSNFDEAVATKKLIAGLKAMLGILAEVKLVEPKAITRSEGKAVRVIDKRNLYK